MKSVFKITNMRSGGDVNTIRNVLSNTEGVIACQINKEKGEVSVVYDNYFINDQGIIANLEDLGYSVL